MKRKLGFTAFAKNDSWTGVRFPNPQAWSRKMMRTFACFILVVGATTNMFAGENTPKVGDRVGVVMTGKVAQEFHRLTVGKVGHSTKGLQVSTMATITRELKDGRYEIEICNEMAPIQTEGKPRRLVTLSTVIDASQLRTEYAPKGTPIRTSPGDRGPATLTQQDHKLLRLDLSELKDGKLRSWKLDEDVANVAR